MPIPSKLLICKKFDISKTGLKDHIGADDNFYDNLPDIGVDSDSDGDNLHDIGVDHTNSVVHPDNELTHGDNELTHDGKVKEHYGRGGRGGGGRGRGGGGRGFSGSRSRSGSYGRGGGYGRHGGNFGGYHGSRYGTHGGRGYGYVNRYNGYNGNGYGRGYNNGRYYGHRYMYGNNYRPYYSNGNYYVNGVSYGTNYPWWYTEYPVDFINYPDEYQIPANWYEIAEFPMLSEEYLRKHPNLRPPKGVKIVKRRKMVEPASEQLENQISGIEGFNQPSSDLENLIIWLVIGLAIYYIFFRK